MFSNKDYSFLSKSLHHIALGSNLILDMLFDIEMFIFKKKIDNNNTKSHIFISGLPRSGSTILMRSLYETNQFASLTYRDMPFVLSPNIWNKIMGKKIKSYPSKERAHGDNIFINIDSPESLDEIFWRVKLKNNYIHSDKLVSHEINDEIINDYRNFVSLILYRYNKKFYLSKNNNNILRLESLIKSFPNCLILIPFRNPIQQANSLLNQQRKFTALQNQDKFVKKYMSYLAHHEFGVIQRPYEFTEKNNKKFENNSLEYWLLQWVNTYDYLSQEKFSQKKNIIYVNYEYLCENPKKFILNILTKANLNNLSNKNDFKLNLSFKEIDIKKSDLLVEANKIFEKLIKLV